jgi:hypothetical protein
VKGEIREAKATRHLRRAEDLHLPQCGGESIPPDPNPRRTGEANDGDSQIGSRPTKKMMKRLEKKMKNIGYYLLLVSIILLFGTVGSMERDYMDFAEGAMKCIIYIAIMLVSTKIIRKSEEKRK